MKIENIEFLNLTPHEITLVGDEYLHTIPPEPVPARCEERVEGDGLVRKVTYGYVSGLPEYKEGVRLIVSTLVAQQVSSWRPDVVTPGGLVRDRSGKIVGCSYFQEF